MHFKFLLFFCDFVVTEEEITLGIFNDPQSRDRCLCYYRDLVGIETALDEKTTGTYIDKVPPHFGLNVEAQHLLKSLKEEKIPERLASENIHKFTVPWVKGGIDPSHSIHSSYLKMFSDQVKLDVLTLIGRAHKTQNKTQDSNKLYEEVSHHASFCKNRCELFRGREECLARIRSLILVGNGRPVVVYGKSGSGKTSLMAKIAQQVHSWIGKSCVMVLRFLGTSPLSSGIHETLSSLCQQLCTIYAITGPDILLMEFSEIVQYFNSLLQDVLPQKVESDLVIILDSVDQLNASNGAHRMAWLLKSLPPKIHIIVSTLSEGYDCLFALKSSIPLQECFIEVSDLPNSTGSEILETWFHNANRTITSTQKSLILDVFSMNPKPLFLRLLFHKAMSWFSYTSTASLDLPRSSSEALNELFDDLEETHGELFLQRAFFYFTASRNGLSDSEIEDVLSLDNEVLSDIYQYWDPPIEGMIRIPQLLWRRVLYEISEFVVRRQADGKTVLGWYHRQFLETAQKRYLEKCYYKLCFAVLTNYFAGNKEKQDTTITLAHRGRTYVNAKRNVALQPLKFSESVYNFRKLSELPYCLAMSGELERLKSDILCNFSWLSTKLNATSFVEIIKDFYVSPSISADPELSLVKEALTLSSHRLKTETLSLAGQLIGRLGGYVESHNPAVLSLLRQAHSWIANCSKCLLTPLNSCLIGPGSPLKTSLNAHPQLIESVAADSSVLVSVSKCNGGALFNMWDIKSVEDVDILHSCKILGASKPLLAVANADSLVAGTCGTSLKVWSAISLEELYTYSSSSVMSSLCFSSSSNLLAAGTETGDLILANMEKSPVETPTVITQVATGSINNMLFAVEDKIVLLGTSEGHLASYSVRSSSLLWYSVLPPQDRKSILCMSTHYNEKYNIHYVITGSEDSNITIRMSRTGHLRNTLKGHRKAIKCITVTTTPSTVLVISGSLDSTIRIWNFFSGTCQQILKGHQDGVWCIATFGAWIVTGSKDDFLKVWNLETGKCLSTFEGHSSWVSSVCVLRDKDIIVSGSNDKSLKLWTLTTNTQYKVSHRHANQPECIATTKGGELIVSGAPDSIKVWDTKSGKCVQTLKDPACCLCASPHNPSLMIAGSKSGEILLLDLLQKGVVHRFSGHGYTPVNCLVISHTLNRLFAACSNGVVYSWNLSTLVLMNSYSDDHQSASLKSLVLSQDGCLLATGSIIGTIRLINLQQTPESRVVLEGHTRAVSCLTIAADASFLASGSDDYTLRLWSLNDYSCISVFTYFDSVKCVSVLSNRTVIAGAHCGKEQLKAWDVQSKECIGLYEGHTHAVMCLVTAFNEQIIITGSRDGTVKVWETISAELMASFDLQSQVKYLCIVETGPLEGIVGATTKSGPVAVLQLHLPNVKFNTQQVEKTQLLQPF